MRTSLNAQDATNRPHLSQAGPFSYPPPMFGRHGKGWRSGSSRQFHLLPEAHMAEIASLRLTINARPRINTVLMLLGFKPWITVKAV